MRRISVIEHLSLDGVMQAPGGTDEDSRDGFAHGGWAQADNDPVLGEEMGRGMGRRPELLFGRRTFEKLYEAWAEPTTPNPFTEVLNNTRKYVVSNSLTEPLIWMNSTLLAGDGVKAVAALTAQPGPDLAIMGSGELVQALHAAGLVDTYTLMIHPVVLGSGRRLFADRGSFARLRLDSSVTTTTGVVIAHYQAGEAVMVQVETLVSGLAYGESTRWHGGRLWLANWGTRDIVAVDADGITEVMATVPASLPFSIDWLPDGRLLVVSGPESRLLRQEPDGTLVTHADLSGIDRGFNEIVVDGRGNAYVNGGGFDLMAGADFAPGVIVLVTPDGTARQVADGIAFGNGMAVTPDNATLIVAESYGNRLTAFDIAPDGTLSHRRVWAELGDGVPDGICLDIEGAAWYADVPNRRCVRVREGGDVLSTVDVDRGCFACMLGGPDGTTLFIAASQWRGVSHMDDPERTGRVYTTTAPAPGAGWPGRDVENGTAAPSSQ